MKLRVGLFGVGFGAVCCLSAVLQTVWVCAQGKDAEPPQEPELENCWRRREREEGVLGVGGQRLSGGDVQVAGTGGRTAGGEPGR